MNASVETTRSQEPVPQGTGVGKTLLRQATERDDTTKSSLYWRVHDEVLYSNVAEFGLFPFDLAQGRIDGEAIYLYHEAGVSVMVYSPSANKKYDLVMIMGLPEKRAEAQRDVENLAKKVGHSIVEVPQAEGRKH